VARTHILIVEGETIAAADVRRAVDLLDYAVVGIAADGAEALRLADVRRPALVLMDLRLRGGMDSADVARQLRQRLGLPVVFMAGESDGDLLARSLAGEPFGYVRVPFANGFLRCAIEVALHRHVVESTLDAQERELGDGLARLDAMINVADAGILIEDEAGRVWRTNPRLCALFGITSPPAQLLGTEAAALRRRIAPCFSEPERFAERSEEIARARRPALREIWEHQDGRPIEFNFVPCYAGERFLGQFWAFREATDPVRGEKPEAGGPARPPSR
jgi:AmiR/NasT family two-component response regulator